MLLSRPYSAARLQTLHPPTPTRLAAAAASILVVGPPRRHVGAQEARAAYIRREHGSRVAFACPLVTSARSLAPSAAPAGDSTSCELSDATPSATDSDSSAVPDRLRLRPYQQHCVSAVLSELARGEYTRLGVSAPTGSGKTAMFTDLIDRIPERVEDESGNTARQVLVVVSSIHLAKQTADAIQRAYPEKVRFSSVFAYALHPEQRRIEAHTFFS